jgi:hypothetical protein
MSCPCGKTFENSRNEDGKFVYTPHRVGNNVLICGKRKSRFPFQCFVGPEWPCMLITYAFIIIPTYFFIRYVAPYWGNVIIAIGIISLSNESIHLYLYPYLLYLSNYLSNIYLFIL